MLGTETLYTAGQTRALDQCAIEKHGIAGVTLMARAAAVAFRYLLELWPETDAITVFCGTGNNGGDGYLLADLAHKRGIAATVVQLGDSSKITGDALLAREQATANGVPVCTFTGYEMPIDGVLVDAMLGTGLGGTLRGEYPAVISSINSSNLPVLAIDIPSGICSDTGRVLGDAVRADLTVTFIGMKRGLFTFEAPEYTGAVQF
ncbi:MAG: NAD(P)H-hydrate epimerase, partial [Halioglobus sp.]|nr:NAD(P)H-hydrate epimerase [Halioglobus sp.]